MKKIISVLSIFCIYSFSVDAQIRLPKFFADNMVLQRNGNIPVWGWAKADEKIIVQFNKQIKTTKADKAGK